MSIAPVIDFDDPRKFPPLLRVRDGVKRPEIRKVMGRQIAGDLRRHFSKLDSERPNKLGGRRTHFYGQARRGVQQPQLIAGDGVMVSVNHVGIAQRYFGGRIERDNGGFLTIPVHPAAHGKRAREFDNLHAIYFETGTGVLARDNSESQTTGIGEVYYRLVHYVDQEADPSVLPNQADLQRSALNAGEAHLRTIIERGNA